MIEIRDITKRQSKSKLNCVRTCPKQYWFSQYYPQEAKDQAPMIRGGEIHTVYEDYYMKPTICNKAFIKTIKTREDCLKVLDKLPNGSKYYDNCIKFANWLEELNFPYPESVEGKIYSEKMDLVIKWDRIDFDGKTRVVWDYKTGRKFTGDAFKTKFKFELMLYAFIYMLETKKRVHKVGIFFADHGKYEMLPVTNDDIKWVIKEIKFTRMQMRDYQNQNVWPAKLGWYCRFCQWNEKCAVYNNKK